MTRHTFNGNHQARLEALQRRLTLAKTTDRRERLQLEIQHLEVLAATGDLTPEAQWRRAYLAHRADAAQADPSP